MSTATPAAAVQAADIITEGRSPGGTKPRKSRMRSHYPTWFFIPAIVLYAIFFAVPTISSFYFSLTRWSLFDSTFIGFQNYVQFFQDPQLYTSFIHTLIYAVLTSGAKVIIGFLLALLLTAPVVGRG